MGHSGISPYQSVLFLLRHVCGTSAARRSVPAVSPDELERRLRERLDALGPAPRAELLHVLMLPDLERAERIGEFYGNPKTRHRQGCRRGRIMSITSRR